MNNSSEVKGRQIPTRIMVVAIGLLVSLMLVIMYSNRVPQQMTCRLVDEQGLSTLKCATTARDEGGRRQGPYRVTRFADMSALNPGSTVMASIELSSDPGNAMIYFMFEEGRQTSFSTGFDSVKGAVFKTEQEIVVTNNRVEFIIQSGSNVRLNVSFTNPVAPDDDEIAVTQEPFISIVEDDAEGVMITQEARLFIVGDGEASITQEPFMSVVGEDDEASVTQQP